MSDPTNSPAQILEERLRLSGGFSAEDRDHVLDLLDRVVRPVDLRIDFETAPG
jgi:hypothetical protein